MFLRPLRAALAAIALAAVALPAVAATVSGTFSFSVPNAGPINPFAGSFDITFDNSANIADTTVGLSNVSLPFTLSSGVPSYAYFPSLGFTDVLILGGSGNGVIASQFGTDDFYVVIRDASSSSRSLLTMVYNTTASGFGSSSIGTITFTPNQTEVPAPAALALFGAGLLGLFALRRRTA